MQSHGPELVFLWLDIDDDDALLEALTVENLPTVLIGVDDSPRFLGPLVPQAPVLERMVRRIALEQTVAELPDPASRAVLARIRADEKFVLARLGAGARSIDVR